MAPYILFHEKGYKVTVASMKGGKIPIDEGSLAEQFVTDHVKQFQADSALSSNLTLQSTCPSNDSITP